VQSPGHFAFDILPSRITQCGNNWDTLQQYFGFRSKNLHVAKILKALEAGLPAE